MARIAYPSAADVEDWIAGNRCFDRTVCERCSEWWMIENMYFTIDERPHIHCYRCKVPYRRYQPEPIVLPHQNKN